MISINASFISTAKMTDPSVVSACSLGLSGSAFIGSGMSGLVAERPVALLTALPVLERNERPTKALEAGVAAAQAHAYAFAATGAETKQTQQHHLMWAFRGLEPWSDPV
ncbi:hypothetical protein [Streptomyces sp. SP18CS02]|uniref:hypothetical protein n=1 Tax=Streptomyces sp. SP18CS02 TaxID=3002531 RepID=UPI002E775FD8|nr:hypothetical protein [Streptomyces sp. SP18CS02]MEE1757355.1 hypothetical protein [Streptomyces sp. SP18CS02]